MHIFGNNFKHVQMHKRDFLFHSFRFAKNILSCEFNLFCIRVQLKKCLVVLQIPASQEYSKHDIFCNDGSNISQLCFSHDLMFPIVSTKEKYVFFSTLKKNNAKCILPLQYLAVYVNALSRFLGASQYGGRRMHSVIIFYDKTFLLNIFFELSM